MVKENWSRKTNEKDQRNRELINEILTTDKDQDERLFEEDNCEINDRHRSPVLDKVQDKREKLNSFGKTQKK